MPLTQPDRRNVTFYDAASPDVALGGLVQNGSITEANFLDMLEIVLVVEEEEEEEEGEEGGKGGKEKCPLRVQARQSNHIISRTDVPLQAGAYDISYDGNGMYYIPLI